MLRDRSSRHSTSEAETQTTHPRVTATEIVEEHKGVLPGLSYRVFNDRADKLCAALDGHVECVNGKWQVVGARIFKAIDEPRDTGLRGPVLVKTFDPDDAAAFVRALVEVLKVEEMTSVRVAARLSKALGRCITSQRIDGQWSKYCPPMGRALEVCRLIDPRSNRGFVVLVEPEEEAELLKALLARMKRKPSLPDLTKPVTIGVVARETGVDRRYLVELIAKGEIPSAKEEPDPNRRGMKRWKLLIEDVLNRKPARRNSWKLPDSKLVHGELRVKGKKMCEIIGCTFAQLENMTDNPDHTPGGVHLHKHLSDGKEWREWHRADGRKPRKGRKRAGAYWVRREGDAVRDAIEAGKPTPAMEKMEAGVLQPPPPVKLIDFNKTGNKERGVPTRVAITLGKYNTRYELLRAHAQGKVRLHVVSLGDWKWYYWHEGDCSARRVTVVPKTTSPKLPPLNETDRRVKAFIDKNPGEGGDFIARKCEISGQHLRRIMSKKLRHYGYHNPGQTGYFPPEKRKNL
jgi:hypothetical protein